MLVTNYSNGCKWLFVEYWQDLSLPLRVLKVFVPFGLSESSWHRHKTALMILVWFAFKNLDGTMIPESFILKQSWIGVAEDIWVDTMKGRRFLYQVFNCLKSWWYVLTLQFQSCSTLSIADLIPIMTVMVHTFYHRLYFLWKNMTISIYKIRHLKSVCRTEPIFFVLKWAI